MTLYKTTEDEIAQFLYWAHEAGKLGLLMCSSGNLSHRSSDGSMLISSTGSWLGSISEDQIAHLRIDDGLLLNKVTPSGEQNMHRTILKHRPDADTVLHFQSPSATTLACMPNKVDYNVIIEVPIYIGKVGHVPYTAPCSQLLADAVGKEMLTTDLVQMQNHGQVVCGKGYAATIQKAVFFELACRIIVQSQGAAQPIPADGIEQLKNYNVSNKC